MRIVDTSTGHRVHVHPSGSALHAVCVFIVTHTPHTTCYATVSYILYIRRAITNKAISNMLRNISRHCTGGTPDSDRTRPPCTTPYGYAVRYAARTVVPSEPTTDCRGTVHDHVYTKPRQDPAARVPARRYERGRGCAPVLGAHGLRGRIQGICTQRNIARASPLSSLLYVHDCRRRRRRRLAFATHAAVIAQLERFELVDLRLHARVLRLLHLSLAPARAHKLAVARGL